MTGPSLSGIVGRKAGTLASFSRYSPAIKASNVVWTAATLDPWLADPQKFIPGTYMTFPGIPQSQIRADLIAYVSKAAAPGQAPKEDFGAGAPGDKDLKKLDPAHRVRAISYCPDAYQVITADGKTHVIWERNLRFQTDSSAIGPLKGAPAIMRAGMEGDRASVIFSAPQEIDSFVKKTC